VSRESTAGQKGGGSKRETEEEEAGGARRGTEEKREKQIKEVEYKGRKGMIVEEGSP
jgi:hypothetical protein